MQKLTMWVISLLSFFTAMCGLFIYTTHIHFLLKIVLCIVCMAAAGFGSLLVYAIWRDKNG